MSDPGHPISRAAQMRETFDLSFARPRALESPPVEDLLAIRIGQEPYALRLSETAGVFADRTVTRLPGGTRALLGIAGFRGAIVPVYDLMTLLEHDGDESRRWLALAAAAPVAFAFPALEGHLRVPLEAIVPHEGAERPRQHVRHYARMEEAVRPIVHLISILDVIRQQASAHLSGRKEQ